MVPYAPMLYLTVVSFILYETLLGETGTMLFRLNTLLYVPLALLILVSALSGRIRTRAKDSAGAGVSCVN